MANALAELWWSVGQTLMILVNNFDPNPPFLFPNLHGFMCSSLSAQTPSARCMGAGRGVGVARPVKALHMVCADQACQGTVLNTQGGGWASGSHVRALLSIYFASKEV